MTEHTYSTRADLITYEIEPALGDYVEDYDIEALSYDVASYDVKTQRYEITVSDEEFWELVKHHDLNK